MLLKFGIIKTMFSLMRRYNSLVSVFMLALYVAIPFFDSMACDDCIGKVPFQGEIAISHKQAPHNDVNSSVSNADSHNQTSEPKETKSYCVICFNTALGVSFYNHTLQLLISEFEGHATSKSPLEPSFSINKPPQNYLFS